MQEDRSIAKQIKRWYFDFHTSQRQCLQQLLYSHKSVNFRWIDFLLFGNMLIFFWSKAFSLGRVILINFELKKMRSK